MQQSHRSLSSSGELSAGAQYGAITEASSLAIRTRLSNATYGWIMNALFHPSWSPRAMRRNFDFFAAMPIAKVRRKFPSTRFEALTLQHGSVSLAAESIRAAPNPARTIVYLHGGGYLFGSIATYRRRAIKLSYKCHAEVIVPEYRLAPEHPYPAALEDALCAWRYAVERAQGSKVFVAGDSAGGGLALALTAYLRDRGEKLPDGIVALSPWTDLAMTGESVASNRSRDCWLKREQLTQWSAWYRANESATHPYVSPVHAVLAGFPPLLLMAGDQEILLDDALRVADNARRAGVRVHTEIGRGMQHDWPLTLPWLAESARAWKTIERFVASV